MSDTNARKELLAAVQETKSSIRCADIEYSRYMQDEIISTKIQLIDHYTVKDYGVFLDQLDFTYYSGYGTQHVHGIVWLADGTWLEREEYDGSEWWRHRTVPQVPSFLKKVNE